jgi:hypothetical protein
MNHEQLENKAFKLGASQFGISNRLNKRFYVIYNNNTIHFGSKTGKTYIDHHNIDLRKNWIARHSKIQNSKGEYVITIKDSPSYWSKNLLW